MVSLANLRRSAGDCQFSSANIADMLDVHLYLLRVNRAALRCTDSILLTAPAVYGSQTVWLYSSTGRTRVVQDCSLMRGLLMLIFRRKKLRVELALDLLALTLLVRQISLSRDCQQNIVWPAVWSVLKLAIHTAGRGNSFSLSELEA